MSRFDKYRADAHTRLKRFDPGATPFLRGSEPQAEAELQALAEKLDKLQNLLRAEGRRKLLLVLQGMDTSGKDGTIRWVFSRTSPLGVSVAAFKAPTEEELARDFLWRCHAVVPRAGEIKIWNRSHYEDLLVPVVEGWIGKKEIERRQRQVNDFERLLCETGTTVIKCMLHIGKEEQRERLQARLDEADKRWKFSMGDLDVREKWDDYQAAYQSLLRATSTPHAPWTIVPADNKLHRNLMVARLIVSALEDMKLQPAPGDPQLDGIHIR